MESEVGEPLLDPPGSEVGLVDDFKKLETPIEQSRHIPRTVANNLETAALPRPVEGEGRDDNVACWGQRFGQRLDVELPVELLREKVQHCAVMPQGDRLCRTKGRHILGDPRHLFRSRSQPGLGVGVLEAYCDL